MRYKFLFLILIFGGIISSCKKSISQEAISLNNRGSKYLSEWNYDSALFFFNKSLEIDSTYFIPRLNKLEVFYVKKLYGKAIKECAVISQNNPSITWIWFMKGLLQEKNGQSADAIKSFTKAKSVMESQLNHISDKKVIQIYKLMIDYSKMMESDSLFTPEVTYAGNGVPFVDPLEFKSNDILINELLGFMETAKIDLILFEAKKYKNN